MSRSRVACAGLVAGGLLVVAAAAALAQLTADRAERFRVMSRRAEVAVMRERPTAI